MDSSFDSTERSPVDYVFFALAFVGFMILVAGVIVSSPITTCIGVLILLFSVLSFRLRRWLAA